MNLAFDAKRWQTVRETYGKWWAGELERPLIQITFGGRQPSARKPDIPYYHFDTFYDLAVPAEKIVDWWAYNLETQEFSPDAFPHAIPYFGPGSAAAYMGAQVHSTPETGTTWFKPAALLEPDRLHLRHQDGNPWHRRTAELYTAARRRFQGQVQLDMTDLGGNLDLLATFRPNEHLLYDLYDHPAEVKRLTWEAHEQWWRYFEEFTRLAGPENPGFTAWTPIYSATPYYMLQCDFAYMIGPQMFDEFVKPELAACCRRLDHAFYHLDGPGQLPHLDSLLSIPELKGIQWVPGDGQPDITQWPDVYRRIHRAGKRIQMFDSQAGGGLKALDIIADQIGSARGIILIGGAPLAEKDSVLAFLTKYGAA
ncbi:MAG: hypothetical protein BWZ02_01258 [Lentisphaerae bacterium ADurb.BinA184]|nr:MAG: hypothetical protein BWZ02_01258 [Lentisphaerae bacterium ADurb.BinA184]